MTADRQRDNVRTACAALAPLTKEHELVITHGNGPQIGVLALESASDPNLTLPFPFDVLGAQTQGMIGYWLLQALQNELPGREIACIINQTLVDVDDPAFADPSKFIGEIYPATHMISISRGVFSKALGLADLAGPLWSMLLSVPVILGAAVLLLKKQER
mgnify:CR=1 FL=1